VKGGGTRAGVLGGAQERGGGGVEERGGHRGLRAASGREETGGSGELASGGTGGGGSGGRLEGEWPRGETVSFVGFLGGFRVVLVAAYAVRTKCLEAKYFKIFKVKL
jgi:hypothetical protein